MDLLRKISEKINKENKVDSITKDEIAKLLNTTPEALEAFEKAYKKEVLESENIPENFFKINAKQAAELNKKEDNREGVVIDLKDRIVKELLNETIVYDYNGIDYNVHSFNEKVEPVTLEEILSIPENLRPQLSGNLIKKDISDDSYISLLQNWKEY